MLCDYKFGDESAEEIRDHFLEMLDRMIQIEDLEIAEEINTGNYMKLFKNQIRVGDRQGGLACCDSWGRKESDTTERLN